MIFLAQLAKTFLLGGVEGDALQHLQGLLALGAKLRALAVLLHELQQHLDLVEGGAGIGGRPAQGLAKVAEGLLQLSGLIGLDAQIVELLIALAPLLHRLVIPGYLDAGGEQPILILRQQGLQALGVLELPELIEGEYGLAKESRRHGGGLVQPVLVAR